MLNRNYLRSSLFFFLLVTMASHTINASWWHDLFNDLSETRTKQDDNNIVVTMSVPAGIRTEDIVVEINNQTLYVHGRSEQKEEIAEQSFYKKSMAQSSFNRVISLDCLVDESESFAQLSNGTLTITMKKIDPVKAASKKIKVVEK